MTPWSRLAAATTMLLALAAAPDGPAPRLDAWRILGPGGGGTFYHPTVSPHDPQLVVETTDMTSGYVSTDGGESWRLFQLGGSPLVFAFDPGSPDVLYAANAALWRSADRGRSWRLVFPSPELNTVEHHWSDHGDTVYTTDEPLYPSGRFTRVHAVAVAPADSRRLVIALSGRRVGPPGTTPESETQLLESHDAGRRWEKSASLGSGAVLALWIERDSLIRAVTSDGAWEGSSAGFARFEPPAGARFDSASFGRDEAGGRTILYATSRLGPGGTGGLHVSEDGGRSWRAAGGALGALSFGSTEGEAWGPAATSRPTLFPVSASAGHGQVAYLGLRGLRHAPAGPKFNGIARTTDGGRTWKVVHEEADRPSSNLRGSWVEERALEDGYSVWFDAPTGLGVGPRDPDLCFATDLFRTYRTRDGGKSWSQLNSAPRGDGAWLSRGLDVTTTYGVHFDPFQPRRVFVSTTDIGLFRSEDGGVSWIGSSRGVPREWRNTTYWMVFDPEERGLAWAAFSGTHDLPRPKMWRRTDPASFRGGVGISSDGGRSWTPSWSGAPEGAVTHLLLDPTSPRGRRTLYACVFGRGLFKSSDGGRSWTARNTGIEAGQPFAWRLSRASDGTLYLVVARRSEGGRIGDAGDGALYRSRDAAEHWERVALPAGVNGPNALTVDTGDPRRLYLSCWPVATPGGDTGGGLLLSEDAGATWTRLRPDSEYVYDVSLDPREPSTLYFTGHDQAAWRSSDRGRTWSRLRGFNFKQGTRVVPDPNDPSKVYITTFGSNVWYGPATGDPNATEDVVRASSRLEQLVEANIRGTHAFQVALAKKEGKGDPVCYAAATLTDAQTAAAEAHQAALLKGDVRAVRAWAEGKPSAFDPATDLEPLLRLPLALPETLPVNVFTGWLEDRTHAPRASVRALASLFQTNLEVERDGERLQELFAFYIGLGLPVYLGQLGLPGSDGSLLEMGRALEGRSCASPVGTSAAEWQIAGRKNWNWGEKNLGIRDDKVLAAELLQEKDVATLVPLMKAMPRQRVAVVGHSFTMQLHWSTPGAFVPVVTAMFARVNPAVEFRQFEGGGLTSSRALARFHDAVIAWKPDTVLLVVLNRTGEDLAAFVRMGRDFAAAGARVVTFDDLHDPDASDPAMVGRDVEAARQAGMTVIEVAPVLAASPEKERFLCLDGIHMTEPYHRLMARQWLGWLVGARPAHLEH